MNRKYILLLPLTLIAGINALSLDKKLEEKRNNLRGCLLSIKSKIKGCKSYEEEYKQTVKEFSALLSTIENTPIDRPFFKISNQEKANDRMLLAHAASGLRETLQGRRQQIGLDPFEETSEPFEQYYNEVLNIYLNSKGGPTSAVTLKNGFTTVENMPQEKLNKAKQTLLEIIKQQSV